MTKAVIGKDEKTKTPSAIDPAGWLIDPVYYYQYKLSDLHDSPLSDADIIGGTPLYRPKRSNFVAAISPSKSCSVVECETKGDSLSPAPALMLFPEEPPSTVRISGGSLSFHLRASHDSIPETTVVDKVTLPPFIIYLDPNCKTSPLSDTRHPTIINNKEKPRSRDSFVRRIRRSVRSPTLESAKDAACLLQQMTYEFHRGSTHLVPDGCCFNWCIHAYAELGLPQQAMSVLDLMFHSFMAGNSAAEPNVRCFTCLLHAWRKSKAPNAPDQCANLLTVMGEIAAVHNLQSCAPDRFSTSVCTSTSNQLRFFSLIWFRL